MTPEQRETRPATTDAMLAQKVERLHQFIYSVSGSGESEAHATIREVLALLAHRAALAPPPMCGTCIYLERMGPAGVRCRLYGGQRDDDDGCIKGYEPTEPTR